MLHFIFFQMNIGLFNTDYGLTEQTECFFDVLWLDLEKKCTTTITKSTSATVLLQLYLLTPILQT